jgi:uncharacterized membrane protein YqaE (UPF0057 family)
MAQAEPHPPLTRYFLITIRKGQTMAGKTDRDSMLGDLIKILFALLLPPLGVFLEVGLTKHFWINILLTILGFFPGMVHAVYVIARH